MILGLDNLKMNRLLQKTVDQEKMLRLVQYSQCRQIYGPNKDNIPFRLQQDAT